MQVCFLELVLLKRNENGTIFLKISQYKVESLFFLEKCPSCYVIFGGCPYFLNRTLNKVCSN